MELNDVSWIRYEINVILTESLRISNVVFNSFRFVPIDLTLPPSVIVQSEEEEGGTYSKSDERKKSFLLRRIRIQFIPLRISLLDHLIDLFVQFISSQRHVES